MIVFFINLIIYFEVQKNMTFLTIFLSKYTDVMYISLNFFFTVEMNR